MLRRTIERLLPFSWRDLAATVGIIGLAALLCAALKPISDSDFHVPLIFVLAVLMVSLATDGYLFGMLSSVIAVLGVNIVFTYPYFQMDFSMTGYPLTFLCMFAVSIITCTLTSRVRKSEKVKAEAEREKMRANLLRAISHDFRTPLTGMIGATNVVLENGDHLSEAEKTALLTGARNDAEWLIHMVENLLSITRIDADSGAELHKEPQAVEEVLGEAVSRFHRQYPAFRVEIRIPEEPLFVEMDATLIEQVLINLLINAAIHGHTADTAVVSVESGAEQVSVSVEDNGEGIRKELLPHLFDEYGARNARERENRNMGIGLSVCSTIVKAHGGQMHAENPPGGGARFTFTLPHSAAQMGGSDYGIET